VTGDRVELLALDEEARRLAQTQFDGPLIVEAGAGTGKTALLTARVVSWCVGPGWERHAERGDDTVVARTVIERVVAITFTDAAAAEMAERVAAALSGLARGEEVIGIDRDLLAVADDRMLAARAAALADEVHRLPALTIHAWCQRQLRAFPLEAGLHPGFEVDADGSRVEAAAVEIVEAALRDLARDPNADDWQALAAAGVVPPRIADGLRQLIERGVRAEELECDPYAEVSIAPLIDRLRGGLAAFRRAEAGRLSDLARNRTAAETSDALARLLDLLEASPAVDEVLGAVARIDKGQLARMTDWSRARFKPTEASALGDSAASVTVALASVVGILSGLAASRPDELAAARRVLADVLRRLTDRLRARGVVTFEDLLVSTERLLASSTAVRAELRRRIDQLMVDEFQDTDDTQCRIVSWLALDGPASGRPGLFIVGDPKQSIYGWRRADLAAYHAFTGRVAAGGGTVRPLVQNFRSVRPILDEVERVVGPVMEEEAGVQPPFQILEATGERQDDPGFSDGSWTAVEHWLAWPIDPELGEVGVASNAREASELEAANLAADIRRLHDESGVPWGDVAVLLRTTTAQEVVLDALRSAGVPFEVAREREYFRQREVVEAAALVRCIVEAGDRVALLTVLRSDAVGIPDAALVPLWESGLPAVIADLGGSHEPAMADVDACIARAVAATPTDLPGLDELPGWPAAVRAAAETIAVLRGAVRRDAPDRFVERLRTLWLAEATASARYLGRFRRARLERFFVELEQALAAPDGSLSPVARFLRRAVEQGRDSQVAAAPDVAADAVHIMTIHGAKGLDFEHVYVVQTHRGAGGGGRGEDVVIRRQPDSLEYRLFGWPTPGFDQAESRRSARERAEHVRLLYVAMTRAKRRLVLSGRWRADGSMVRAADAKSMADLISHRLEPEATGEQARRLQRHRREVDRPVQWLMLGVDSPTPDDLGDRATGRTFEAARVERETARLAELRDHAAARSALPATAAVTALSHDLDGERGRERRSEEVDAVPREAALAVGTIIHRLLERLDLAADLPEQVAAAEPWLHEELLRAVPPQVVSAARAWLATLLGTIRGGTCLSRLGEIADRVVARELPLLLPPGPGDPVVGALIGSADLVYLEAGRVIVADYKTDAVRRDRELAERAQHYRLQVERYGGAVQSALDLDEAPLMELWFLAADRIVRLEPLTGL
jgi:ATP-dependent helicase/nuclease subunit A